MPALLNNGARKTAGCYSSSEARKNIFTAAICTWMDNTYKNTNTNNYNCLFFGQNRLWMHARLFSVNEPRVILGPTRSQTFRFSNPGGCRDVCVTFCLMPSVSIFMKDEQAHKQ